MRLRDIGQGEAVRNLETSPSRCKGIAKSLGSSRLQIRREVIASQEKDAGTLEKQGPEGNGRAGGGGGIGADGSALRQQPGVHCDVCIERGLYDVVYAVRSNGQDALHDVVSCDDDFVRSSLPDA